MSDDEAFNAALDRLAALMNEPAVKQWREIRKEAGQKLDPEIAEVTCLYVEAADPYGLCAELPEGVSCVGREHFARSVGSKMWIVFSDLPETTVERLWQRIGDGDFDAAEQESNRIRPLTFEQARKEVQVALRLHLDTIDIVIEEFSQLPDGRFQFIAREHPSRPD